MLSTYLSKTKFNIDEKFNAKDIYIYKTMAFEFIL